MSVPCSCGCGRPDFDCKQYDVTTQPHSAEQAIRLVERLRSMEARRFSVDQQLHGEAADALEASLAREAALIDVVEAAKALYHDIEDDTGEEFHARVDSLGAALTFLAASRPAATEEEA